MRRLARSMCAAALATGTVVAACSPATARPKPASKPSVPTFVVNMEWHMHQTGTDSDNSSDIRIVNGVFVGGPGSNYHFGVPTGGTFTVLGKEHSTCWTQEESGSGELTSMVPLELLKNTAIRFFTHKGTRLGLLQPPLDIAVPVTGVKAGCDYPVESGPRKIGDLTDAGAGIVVPILRCDGLPSVNQGGDTAFPGGVLSKSSPWTFTIACTAPGTPNANGSVTTGTVTGTVSYTGPTPVPRNWITAG